MEGDDPGARRHRGARLGDHPAPADLGGVRAPGRLQRPARRVPRPASCASAPTTSRRRATASRSTRTSAAATPPRSSPATTRTATSPRRASSTSCSRRTIGPVKDAGSTVYLRPETAQGIFLDFKTTLQYARQQAAVRDRADRQVVPQRDHAGQLHLPHARVRADGDGVLRAARRGDEVARLLDGAAHGLVRVARDRARGAAAAPARRGRAVALLERHERHRVPLSDRLVRARGDRQPRRLRPDPARRALRAEARVRGHGQRRALRART